MDSEQEYRARLREIGLVGRWLGHHKPNKWTTQELLIFMVGCLGLGFMYGFTFPGAG